MAELGRPRVQHCHQKQVAGGAGSPIGLASLIVTSDLISVGVLGLGRGATAAADPVCKRRCSGVALLAGRPGWRTTTGTGGGHADEGKENIIR